jgi:hypothetical protein
MMLVAVSAGGEKPRLASHDIPEVLDVESSGEASLAVRQSQRTFVHSSAA